MNGIGISKRRSILIFASFFLALSCRALADDSSNCWGLRLSGGYDFGFNYEPGINDSNWAAKGLNSLSSGTIGGTEIVYSGFSSLQFSLGIFPDVVKSYIPGVFGSSSGDYDITIEYAATYYPILANIYLNHSLPLNFNLFVGFGAGVVPATDLKMTYSPNNNPIYDINIDLGACLALREVLGLDWMCSRYIHLGLLAQVLTFDSPNENIWVYTSTKSNQDVNQIAPMAYAEFRI